MQIQTPILYNRRVAPIGTQRAPAPIPGVKVLPRASLRSRHLCSCKVSAIFFQLLGNEKSASHQPVLLAVCSHCDGLLRTLFYGLFSYALYLFLFCHALIDHLAPISLENKDDVMNSSGVSHMSAILRCFEFISSTSASFARCASSIAALRTAIHFSISFLDSAQKMKVRSVHFTSKPYSPLRFA